MKTKMKIAVAMMTALSLGGVAQAGGPRGGGQGGGAGGAGQNGTQTQTMSQIHTPTQTPTAAQIETRDANRAAAQQRQTDQAGTRVREPMGTCVNTSDCTGQGLRTGDRAKRQSRVQDPTLIGATP